MADQPNRGDHVYFLFFIFCLIALAKHYITSFSWDLEDLARATDFHIPFIIMYLKYSCFFSLYYRSIQD